MRPNTIKLNIMRWIFFSRFVCVCATSVKYRGARGAGETLVVSPERKPTQFIIPLKDEVY